MGEVGHPFDLSGLVVLVTGGNSGIGLGIAAGLVKAGAAVSIASRREDQNQLAVDGLRELGGTAIGVHCDVSDERSVVSAVETTIESLGRLDGAVVNAGAQARPHRLHEYPLQDWRATMAVNLDGAFVTVRETAAALIRRQERGSIVVVGSISSRYGQTMHAPYAASKSAMESLVRTAAVELARHRIRVNAVLPGWTDTPLLHDLVNAAEGTLEARARDAILARTPMRRWASPEEFGGIAVYLMSSASAFHTGDVITVDGGYSIF